jgi:hypothetical protein
VALLALVVAVPVAVRSHPPGTAAGGPDGLPAGGAAGSAPGLSTGFTSADVADLLDRYAASLRGRNLPAFLAELDPRNARLVATQRRLFDNLGQLDLAAFSFIPVDSTLPSPDPTRPGSYTKGWAEVWRLIQIDGIDPKPGAQPFQIQLEVVNGKLTISDITPSSGPGQTRQPMPWDVSTLRVVRGRNVVVAATPDVVGTLPAVLRQVEAAVADAAPCWPPDWQHSFTIFATGDRRAFDTWFRSEFTSTEFIGFEVGLPVVGPDGSVLAGAQEGVPQVVIDVPGAQRAPLGFRQLLEHELTHAASGAQRNPSTETWAIEGYADFVAFHSVPLRLANRGGTAYRRYHLPGGLSVGLPPDAGFYGKNAALNYDLSFLALWYLRQRYGLAAVVGWFHAANADGHALTLLQQRFHLTPQRFVHDWARWTFAQLS